MNISARSASKKTAGLIMLLIAALGLQVSLSEVLWLHGRLSTLSDDLVRFIPSWWGVSAGFVLLLICGVHVLIANPNPNKC